MRRKSGRFNPVITRVKLNPEQAVLTCACYDEGYSVTSPASALDYCNPPLKEKSTSGCGDLSDPSIS